MKKADIRTGVVYAYQRFGRASTPEPIMFLGMRDYGQGPVVGELWQEVRLGAFGAFREAAPGRRVQAGTVGNDGSIGYPAVLLATEKKPTAEQIDMLRSTTPADFRNAENAWGLGGNRLLMVVTSMARVTGPWDESALLPGAEAGR